MSIAKTFVETDTTNEFLNPTRTEENGAVDHIDITNLDAETSYYVRAGIVDDLGNITYSENTETFTTAVAGIDYFYVENRDISNANTLQITKISNPETGQTLSYSFDKNNWDLCLFVNNSCSIPFGDNEKIFLRSSDGLGDSNKTNSVYKIYADANFNVGGDITTLIDYTNNSISNIYAGFSSQLFNGSSHLISAGNLDFSKIETVNGDWGKPGLTALFDGCINLIEAPSFPNLISTTYNGVAELFRNCSSLTTSPDLRRLTTMTGYGLTNAFYGCTSMRTIYAPNVSSWDTSLFNNWVVSLPRTGTIYCPAGVTIPTGNNGIPDVNWTRIDY